ncbi:hypothetical protein OVA24_16510 [Luteolibacter sp. SL250]|uniref:hypothetical protein n=1 Tax=Luteolibacter sp. SL250 TaxID=2995170 RepID=UPI00227199FA|nr:hypothetical protein [Luteolibacter sp. SL250]WAC18834.1 hypothetical protein OVA24_16510 [Luteolibacter sp. SL250]
MISKRTFLTAALPFLASAAASHAVTVTFDTAADFDNNFWTQETHSVVWNSNSGNGRIQKSDETNSAHRFIYNTTSTGGGGGTGGTSASSTLNTFQDFTVQADYRSSSTGSAANSLGFWVKGNASGSAGYYVVFRLQDGSANGGQADMRIWGPDSGGGGIGTALLASTDFTATSNVASSTDYTFRLGIQDVSGGVRFTGSMWNVLTGQQIGSDINYTHSSVNAITGAGQVGIRIGTGGGGSVSAIDNFMITPIPEPSAAALGLIATAAAAFRRRR